MRVQDLPPARPGRPAPPDLDARRQAMAQAAETGAWRTEPPARTESLRGVRVLRFAPAGPRRGVVVHFHGGGYRLGCPEMIGPYATALAARCGVEVVCPAYRLAPEHAFPAGLSDGISVVADLRKEGERPLIISGDSAGGGLAAALTRVCVAEGAAPDGLVLLSAWLDLTLASPTYQANAATDPLFSFESARDAAELYLQGQDAKHPLASPLLAPLAGFPPTLVSLGLGEVLAGEGRAFHAALQTAGVDARLSAIAGMDHVAVTRGLTLPGAAATFETVADFVDGVIERRP